MAATNAAASSSAVTAAAVTFSALKCAICDDDASAFNFGVLSCESCKAFFRRAIRSNKVPVCLFSGCCAVSVQTRRFCPACRLRKCQTTGMNKSHVLSEEQRKERQRRIDSSRLRRSLPYPACLTPGPATQRALRPILSVSSGSSLAVTQEVHVPAADEEAVPSEQLLPAYQLCRSVALSLNVASDQNECSVGSPKPRAGSSAGECLPSAGDAALPGECSTARVLSVHDDLLDTPAELPTNALFHQLTASFYPHDSSCFVTIEALLELQLPCWPSLPEQLQQQQPPPPSLLRAATSTQRQLSPQACNALEDLTRKYKSKLSAARRSPLRLTTGIGGVTPATGKQVNRDADRGDRLRTLAFVLNDLVSGYVLFARELPGVALLPIGAQMALAKACAPTFILIRAAELYDDAQAAWVDEPGDLMPVAIVDDLLSEFRRKPQVEIPVSVTACCCHRFREMLLALKRQIPVSGSGIDQTAIALLQAIALLSPELIPMDAASQDALGALADAQQHYACLLQQHLEATSSFEEAAELWPKLLSLLDTCKSISNRVSDVLLSCDAVRGDQLLAEILDGRPAEHWLPPLPLYPNIACRACSAVSVDVLRAEHCPTAATTYSDC